MTLISPRPMAPVEWDTEALFKEAKRRRRRRWAVGLVSLLIVIAAAILAVQGSSSPRHPRIKPGLGLPEWNSPSTSSRPAPTEYVAGDGKGGIGVYATATGALVRTIAPQNNGGPDQQAMVTSDGKTVYFARPNGGCPGIIEVGPVSGASSPVSVISIPGIVAVEPSPSPASSDLAWVGANCGSDNTSSSLYVTNLSTRTRTDLGPYSGSNSDDGVAWSDDGHLLAVESGSTVRVIGVDQTTTSGRALIAPDGCRTSSPAFVPTHDQVAAIRTCYNTKGTETSSSVLVFNSTTGRPVARLFEADPGRTIESMSVDSSGHVLLGVTNGSGGAELDQVKQGRLVTISAVSLTGAQW